MDIKRARALISNYYMMSRNKETLKSELLANITDPLVIEVLIKQTDNHTFRSIVTTLGLPDTYIVARETLERNIIHNATNYPLEQVQQALCDILFHNNKHNSILTIQTIQERASMVPGYNNLYQNFSPLYEKVMYFLSLDPNTTSPEEITTLLQEIIVMNNELIEGNTNMFNITDFLFKTAKDDFKSELGDKMKSTESKIFNGVEPELRVGPNGKPVKIYTLRNQTENQRNLHILARTQNRQPYMTEEDAMNKHIAYVGQYPRASYSIFTESLHAGFAGKYRITFGYSNVENSQILSCTTKDGQTNQWEIMDGKVTIRPQFQPVDTFIENTGRYNELVFDNPETIQPTMILINSEEELTEETIATAEAMNLPIVLIDREAYPEHIENTTPYTHADWYEYESFLQNELEPISIELIED